MALLVKPNSITQGSTAEFQLDLADLLGRQVVASADADNYFRTAANLDKVVFVYRSSSGRQTRKIVFQVPANYTSGTIAGNMQTSARSRLAFNLQNILLLDQDGGFIVVPASAFSADNLNLTVSAAGGGGGGGGGGSGGGGQVTLLRSSYNSTATDFPNDNNYHRGVMFVSGTQTQNLARIEIAMRQPVGSYTNSGSVRLRMISSGANFGAASDYVSLSTLTGEDQMIQFNFSGVTLEPGTRYKAVLDFTVATDAVGVRTAQSTQVTNEDVAYYWQDKMAPYGEITDEPDYLWWKIYASVYVS